MLLRRASAARGAGNFQEMSIRGDLIEDRQEAFGFRQQPVVHVRLELHERVVDSEPVKFGLALKQDQILLLLGQPFKNLHELRGRGIQRVIERGFVDFRAVFIAESFLSEIGDFFLDVEISIREMIQVRQ